MGRVRVMAMGHRRVWERFYRIFWPLSAFFVPTVQQDLLAPSPMWGAGGSQSAIAPRNRPPKSEPLGQSEPV